MRAGQILDAMTYIDESLILQAEKTFYRRKHVHGIKTLAAAACVSFFLLAGGAAAYGAGAFDGLLEYFGGDAEEYLQQISAEDLYAADEDIEMTVQGVIASGNNIHLIVSLDGISEAGKQKLDEIGMNAVYSFEVFTDDEYGKFSAVNSISVGTLTEPGLKGIRPKTEMSSTQMTFSVDAAAAGNRAVLYFENLSVDIYLSDHRFDMLTLKTENSETTLAGDVKMSAAGFSFTMQEVNLQNLKVQLIKADGSLYEEMGTEIGYHCSIDYGEGDSYSQVTGRWCEGTPVNNAVLNLEKFCGIQINGENFYYKMPVSMAP